MFVLDPGVQADRRVANALNSRTTSVHFDVLKQCVEEEEEVSAPTQSPRSSAINVRH